MTTRRSFLIAAMSGLACGIGVAGVAVAEPVSIGAVRVDASRLAEQGWGSHSSMIADAMQRELLAALGPSVRRGAGNTLLVTIRGVWLASYAGGGGGGKPGGAGASNDSLDSVASLIGRDGRLLASWPILSTELSSSGGAWYLPDIDQRRVAALVRNNVLWIKRYVGS